MPSSPAPVGGSGVAARIAALHVYPVKSAAGLPLEQATVSTTGIAQDRRWMVVTPEGRFLTQRVLPQLALVHPRLSARELRLEAAHQEELRIPLRQPRGARSLAVTVWNDRCRALDEGDAAAQWLQAVLGRPCRLVRFDPRQRRPSSPRWTGGFDAHTRFADAYPLLVVGAASLRDLNRRIGRTLPMNRFRPNLVLEGIEPYAEDRIDELCAGDLRLKLVKPCIRCRITTTDQDTGRLDGEEPLAILRSYRYHRELHGVAFGWNAIVIGGGARLQRDQMLQVRWRPREATAALAAASPGEEAALRADLGVSEA